MPKFFACVFKKEIQKFPYTFWNMYLICNFLIINSFFIVFWAPHCFSKLKRNFCWFFFMFIPVAFPSNTNTSCNRLFRLFMLFMLLRLSSSSRLFSDFLQICLFLSFFFSYLFRIVNSKLLFLFKSSYFSWRL